MMTSDNYRNNMDAVNKLISEGKTITEIARILNMPEVMVKHMSENRSLLNDAPTNKEWYFERV